MARHAGFSSAREWQTSVCDITISHTQKLYIYIYTIAGIISKGVSTACVKSVRCNKGVPTACVKSVRLLHVQTRGLPQWHPRLNPGMRFSIE